MIAVVERGQRWPDLAAPQKKMDLLAWYAYLGGTWPSPGENWQQLKKKKWPTTKLRLPSSTLTVARLGQPWPEPGH